MAEWARSTARLWVTVQLVLWLCKWTWNNIAALWSQTMNHRLNSNRRMQQCDQSRSGGTAIEVLQRLWNRGEKECIRRERSKYRLSLGRNGYRVTRDLMWKTIEWALTQITQEDIIGAKRVVRFLGGVIFSMGLILSIFPIRVRSKSKCEASDKTGRN